MKNKDFNVIFCEISIISKLNCSCLVEIYLAQCGEVEGNGITAFSSRT